MTTGDTASYEKFLERLRSSQADATDELDVRKFVLQHRFDQWNVGFKQENLDTAFSANLSSLFPNVVALDSNLFGVNRKFLVYGALVADAQYSHKSTSNIFPAIRPEDTVIFFEMGFLASASSWSESLQNRTRETACLGYVYDDLSHYYMSDYPNRLIRRLNSDHTITASEKERVDALIERISSKKISKYNSQPIYTPEFDSRYKRRVLVCDQNFSDASTIYGRADEQAFQEMLEAAIEENPDAEIIVKTHPDIAWTKSKERKGFFGHLQSSGRVRVLRDPVNPFCLFEIVDTVYVGTSGMGFEALLAGKKVVCFGAPFYSGWGLTDDRQVIPYRSRKRTLQELFHYFYVWYTIYHVPGKDAPCEIEKVLDFIELNRPVFLPPSDVELKKPPRVSIVIPVYGVEQYIEECLRSIQRQTLREIEIIVVDDQSPDKSSEIVERLARVDPRVRLITLPKNVGPGFARNEGLKLARGAYILFIDPDDYMPRADHLSMVVACADNDGAEMVRYRKLYERVEDERGQLVKMRRDHTESFFEEPFRRVTLDEEESILHSRHFWNWLYRRDFLTSKNIRFVTTYREERSFVLRALLSARVISSSGSEGVVYRIRKNSAVRRQQTMRDVLDQVQNFEEVVSILEEFGALDANSRLRNVTAFQVSQFLHYLIFGFAYATARNSDNPADLEEFITRVGRALDRTGLTHRDLLATPSQMSKKHLRANAYGLMFEALRSGSGELLEVAKSLQAVKQSILMDIILTEPMDEKDNSFQSALSTYARNDYVTKDKVSDGTATKPRILIHIGSTKTGSTYIQHYLEQNRAALLRQGVWYPEVGLFWQKDRPHKQAGHVHFTPAAVKGDQSLKQYIESGLALAQGRIHTIVLSSEAFFLNRKALKICDYFAGYPLEMLVYLRRQDDWANSQYCEFVGGGAVNRVNVPVEVWLEEQKTKEWLSYKGLLDQWSAKIGQEHVIVRPYEKEQFTNNDLIDDFCTAAGLAECAALPRPSERQRNDFPLDERHLGLMLSFNQMPYADQDHYLRFVDAVTTELAARYPSPSRPDMLNTEQRKKILAEYADENGEIAGTYCSRHDGRLFNNGLVREKTTSLLNEAPIDDFTLFLDCYRKYAGIPQKIESNSFKKQKTKPVATRVESATAPSFVLIRRTWPLHKRIRVTIKNIMLRRPTHFERSFLDFSPVDANAPRRPKTPTNADLRHGPIRNTWPAMKRARVLIKNIYLGRPIYFG